jgi:hypothetical protein
LRKLIGNSLRKIGLKRYALKIYFSVTNGWTDMIISYRKKMIPVLVGRRSAGGIYAIDLDSDWLGLGARIVKTLEILLYCDERGLRPLVRYNYFTDDRSNHDYFGELFGYRLEDRETVTGTRYTRIRDIYELGWPEDYNKKLRLNIAGRLFGKYLEINQAIQDEVFSFCQINLEGDPFLGVHFRGTDKAGEAPLVAKEHLLNQIRNVLGEKPQLKKIFFSTDDQSMLDFVHRAGLGVPVIFREDAVRSTDGNQFHRKVDVSKSVVHRDAIVNMLILSRSGYLLKTASILSDCSVVFNPDLEVRLISRPHSESLTWWPCSEILQNQAKRWGNTYPA